MASGVGDRKNMKVNATLEISHKFVKLSTYLCLRRRISWDCWGLGGCNAISSESVIVRGCYRLARRGDAPLPGLGGVGGRLMHFKAGSTGQSAWPLVLLR